MMFYTVGLSFAIAVYRTAGDFLLQCGWLVRQIGSNADSGFVYHLLVKLQIENEKQKIVKFY